MAEGLVDQLLKFFLKPKEFTFRFDEYDGSEETSSISDSQVIEYEFINAGSTICIISNLKLYPEVSGMIPSRVKLTCNYNERDVTVYPFKFIPLDLVRVIDETATTVGLKPIEVPIVVSTDNITLGVGIKDPIRFNRLIVISKIKAKSVPKSIEPHGKKNKTQKFR